MTRDDIIKLAREAGFQVLLPRDHVDGTGGVYVSEDEIAGMLECFANLVAAAEREAVLKILDDCLDYKTLIDVAKAIRARGET